MQRPEPGSIGSVDFAPRAVLRISVGELRNRLGIHFDDEIDDLDSYKIARLNRAGVIFAFMRHKGEPDNTVNLCLPSELGRQDVEKAICNVMKQFGLPPEVIEWRSSSVIH